MVWFALFVSMSLALVPGGPVDGVRGWAAPRAAAASEALGGDPGEWVFPGEYESHQAMWMLWPT